MAMAARARSFLSKPFAATLVASIRSPYLLRRRPLLAALSDLPLLPAVPGAGGFRRFSSRPASSSLNDPSPNWSNRPPKETILLDGCDFEHWLVVMEKPEGEPTRDEIIDSYIKTLAAVVGSEEEARMKIYSVSTRHYFAFGALVSEELSYKIKELPRVRWVLPDSYLHVPTKDYGGEPFINGQAVPYDPKYHEEWVRNNARANERSRRPRNSDRSRNFERRRENMQNRDFQNTTPQPPPFYNAQNAGPASPPAPPMPNAQAAMPRGPGGPSVNHSVPPNSRTPQPPPFYNAQNAGPASPPAPPMPNAQAAMPRGPGSPSVNQSVPPNSSMPSNGFQNQSVGGMNGPNYQSHGSGVYSNQGVNGVPNSGFHHQGGGYQNQGMPHGAHLNQVGGGYQNQGPGFQNQGLGGGPGNGYPNQGMGNLPNGDYQNQRNFTNQSNYQGFAPYQNQGVGGTPNSGFQHTYVPNRESGNMPNSNANQGRDLPGRDAPTVPSRD